MLHPRIPEMVDAAKSAGCDVGITTNGDLLADAIDWIVARRVDLVTVSVAGDDATHAELRSGSTLGDLWETVERLVARRNRRKRPRVKVSYLLTRRNLDQLARVVRAAAEVGADELFVTHLECTPSAALLEAAAFDASGLPPKATEAIEAATREASSCGIAFRAPALAGQELLVCALDPLSFVYVSWDGTVGPCVNLGLPIRGPIPRHTETGPIPIEPVVYGVLADKGLREIVRGERFRSFTKTFESRLAVERRFLESVVVRSGRDALDHLDDADRRRDEELAANPFPKGCAGCHKMAGW